MSKAGRGIFVAKTILQPVSKLLYFAAPRLWRWLRTLREEGLCAPYEKAARNERPQLFVDVSMTAHHDAGTGIQRVVRSLAGALGRIRPEATACVSLCHGKLTPAIYEDEAWRVKKSVIELKTGDNLFFLDFSSFRDASARQAAKIIHEGGGQVVGMIYDWIPADHPEWFASKAFVKTFLRWQTMLLECCDAICCDSVAAADATARHFRRLGIDRDHPLRLYPIPMGAELRPSEAIAPREEIMGFIHGGRTVLMVGTMEPRKGYDTALAAMRSLWEAEKDVRLLIVGQYGWGMETTAEKAEMLRRAENPILWIKDADDGELSWCYAHASLLLSASLEEGFGLPIIEAAQHGLPLLLSDIPVFHEVAGNHADYFPVGDSRALAQALSAWFVAETHPDSRNVCLYQWEDAAQAVFDVFDGKAVPYKILE